MTIDPAERRCAIVHCHPRSTSFCAAVAVRAEEVARAAGLYTITRDLYAMAFSPVLHARDISVPKGGNSVAPDVEFEVTLLGDPKVVILVYPVWFGSAPALLKGYIECVLGACFAGLGSVPLPAGPSPDLLVTIATSGASASWIANKGIAASAGNIFGAYLAGALAIPDAEHIAVDNVTPTMSQARGTAELDKMARSMRDILAEDAVANALSATSPAPADEPPGGTPTANRERPLFCRQNIGDAYARIH